MRSILDDFSRDLAHGIRLLRRNRGFAAVIVSTLAVAIAATVTVFSIVDAWLLRPLNFPDADRLVIAFAAAPDKPSEPAVWLPYRAYLGWKEQSRSFASISAAFFRGVTISTPDDARSSVGLDVSPDFFQTFGVAPLLGRTLTESDLTGPPVVVLSHGLWLRQFAGSPGVIGTSIRLSDVPHQVVGVMPRDFDVRILDRPEGLEFWTPLRNKTAGYTEGGMGPVAIVARLRKGLSIAAAQSEVARITRTIESGYQMNFNQFVVNLTSLQADNSRTIRSTLLTVSAAVVSLLLIAAMNVGALTLGRGIGRMREAAVRAALGSGRSRLIRQFLAESLLVSLLGGLAGIALALVAIKMFIAWNPLGTLPANTIQIDVRALVIAGAAMLVTTAICGVVPALRVSSADPNDALHAGGERGATVPTERTQTVLLVGQMAISVVVLVAATLLTQTFMRLNAEPLGFDSTNLWVAPVNLPNDPFDTAEERNTYYRQLDEAVRAIPGVTAVAASTAPPLNSGPVVTVNTGPAGLSASASHQRSGRDDDVLRGARCAARCRPFLRLARCVRRSPGPHRQRPRVAATLWRADRCGRSTPSPRRRTVAADRWRGRERAVVVLQHARVANRSDSVSALCAGLQHRGQSDLRQASGSTCTSDRTGLFPSRT